MNRQMFNALCAQYATPEVSGDGLVSWEHGKKCVIPSVKLYGAAMQDGEPTPDAPIMPVCNSGVFTARGKNQIDVSTAVFDTTQYGGGKGFGISLTKEIGRVTLRIELKGNTGYTLNIDNSDMQIWRMSEMDSQDICTKNWNWYAYSAERGPLVSFITQASTVYAWFTLKKKDESSVTERDLAASKPQFVFGTYTAETMPPYTPYYDGGQAQAPELWAIPGTEYRDEWDPQTGRGIRRVKKLVLTPDLNWQIFYAGENGFNFAYISHVPKPENAIDGMFSHGKYYFVATGDNINSACVLLGAVVRVRVGREASVDDFKAFLQEQIDANTPVTIWYPLAEPEPFTTAPAKLTMPTGYGQIIQTSGDVPDCPITAKYLTHS